MVICSICNESIDPKLLDTETKIVKCPNCGSSIRQPGKSDDQPKDLASSPSTSRGSIRMAVDSDDGGSEEIFLYPKSEESDLVKQKMLQEKEREIELATEKDRREFQPLPLKLVTFLLQIIAAVGIMGVIIGVASYSIPIVLPSAIILFPSILFARELGRGNVDYRKPFILLNWALIPIGIVAGFGLQYFPIFVTLPYALLNLIIVGFDPDVLEFFGMEAEKADNEVSEAD